MHALIASQGEAVIQHSCCVSSASRDKRNKLTHKGDSWDLGVTQPTSQPLSMEIEGDVHKEEVDERVVTGSILNQHAQCQDSGHKLSFATEAIVGQLPTHYTRDGKAYMMIRLIIASVSFHPVFDLQRP